MKKKKIILIISVIILVIVLLPFIDYALVKNLNTRPIFATKKNVNEFQAINYKVIRCKEKSGKYKNHILAKNETYTCPYVDEYKYSYTLDVKKDSSCKNTEPVLYYQDTEGRNYYTVCLSDLNIKQKDKTIPLKDILTQNEITIDDMLSPFTIKEIYKDGGSTLYQSQKNSNYTNQTLSVLKCNTIDKIQNYYFGDESLNYDNNYCQNQNDQKEYQCGFTKTFQVIAINKDENNITNNITVRIMDTDNTATVNIDQNFTSNMELNQSYEFTFQTDTMGIDDQNIADIFEKSIIVQIIKTDKTAQEQIQEPTCK